MSKPLGRPAAPEDQRKEQHNIRFTKEKMHQIKALFPDSELNFPQKIYALIDDYIKQNLELVKFIFDNNIYSIIWQKKGAERICYLNNIEGEKDLYAYKNTSLKNIINDIIKKDKLTKEYIINNLIPALEMQDYLIQIIDISESEIFDVWAIKKPKEVKQVHIEKCNICKQRINAFIISL